MELLFMIFALTVYILLSVCYAFSFKRLPLAVAIYDHTYHAYCIYNNKIRIIRVRSKFRTLKIRCLK